MKKNLSRFENLAEKLKQQFVANTGIEPVEVWEAFPFCRTGTAQTENREFEFVLTPTGRIKKGTIQETKQ